MVANISVASAANTTTPVEIGRRGFVWGSRTYVMGIVNVTPDSFSGDGCPETESAITRALAQLAAGADIVDIGAESSRPGHRPIPVAEERQRLLPVVRGVRERAPDAVISIDTFKADLFVEAHAAGSDMLNSIWGLHEALLATALSCDVAVVIMHNKRVPIYETNVVDEVLTYLEQQANSAVAAGISPGRVILDPGIGFGKLPEHNLAILASLDRLVTLGFPTLLGTSRKSTIGNLTGKPIDGREFGTAATIALAASAKIDIVRVHDVGAMKDVLSVADAIERGWRPAGWNEQTPRTSSCAFCAHATQGLS